MSTRILLSTGVFAVAVSVIGLSRSHGQPAQPLKADPGRPSPGINSCRTCHSGADTGQAAGFVKNYKSNEFCLLNESTTWDQKDVHSQAMVNLTGPLGKRMEKVLGYKVAEDVRCLSCHSTDISPDKKQKTVDDFATTEGGVNCTACHGLGRNWQQDHYEEPRKKGDPMPWRAMDPAAKEARGMADLRNPAGKAKLCASCHVGNSSEGKVVTHEMYAAGHPPLPPFELATFMESEPKHWGYPTDDKLKFFTEFAAKSPEKTWPIFRFHPADKESYLTRHVACGAVAALQAEVRQLGADAERAAKPDGEAIDFARFDCYACHHDLKVPSARQKRGYDGPPGRPALKAWAGGLPAVVAAHAAGLDDPKAKKLAAEFGPKWEAVRKATFAKPFGDPGTLAKASAELDAWCAEFLAFQSDTATPIYTPEQSARLMDMIRKAAEATKFSAEPEAASQLTWAYLTLRDDLKKPVAADKLAELEKVLATRVRFEKDYTEDGKKPKPVEAYLGERLRRFAAYDADAFEKAFKAIGEK